MKKIVLLLLLFNAYVALTPQQFQFSYLGTNDGLSQSTVNCIFQDSVGFIWIGTDDGLNRYDGVHFEIFRTNDNKGLASNIVYAIQEDCDGNLLIGTSRGLSFYDRETDDFSFFNVLPGYKISSILVENCNFWIGSQNLYHYNVASKKLQEFFPDPNSKGSISNGLVNVIFKDRKGDLWVGTQRGLNKYVRSTGSFITYFHDPEDQNSLDDNVIRSITEDQKGTLWVGTSKGLNRITKTQTIQKIRSKKFSSDPKDPSGIGPGAVLSLYCDSSNAIWIGTEHGGLSVLSENTRKSKQFTFETHFQNNWKVDGVNGNTIYYIAEDKHKNVWVGTFGSGINVFYKNANQIYHVADKVSKVNTTTKDHVNVFFDESRFLWIGSEGGLLRYDKETKEHKNFVHEPSDPLSIGSNAVWEIYKDKEGRLWIGTWAGGLNLYDYKKETFTRFKNTGKPNSVNNDNVFSIVEDNQNNLWIGTMGGGLNRYDKLSGTFSYYTIENSNIRTNYIENIITTKNDRLLLANNHGAIEYDYKLNEFKPITVKGKIVDKLDAVNVFDIFEDTNSNLWFATDFGLWLVNEELYRCYTVKDGLSSNAIKSIVQDKSQKLWIGSNNGLSAIDIKANSLKRENLVVKNYTAEDGLQGAEFSRRASLVRGDGLLYFGGTNGYNYFYPSKLRDNPVAPEVQFTDFKIFNTSVLVDTIGSPLKKHINYTEKITLDHDQSVFSISYVGLNYMNSENNQYAYRMKGFEKNWNYVGAKKEATYTNLNPGAYTFQVKASNNDGVWNPIEREVAITIQPPFFRTKLAYTFYIVLGILGLFLFRKYSIIANEEKNKLLREHLDHMKEEEIMQSKLHFFTNLSHEIRTPLTLIDGPIEGLLQMEGDNDTKDQLKLINRNVKRLKRLINQLLDFRKLETGNVQLQLGNHDLVDMIKQAMLSFQAYYKDRNINVSFEHELQEVIFPLDYEKINTVIYNLISNAIKYNRDNGSIVISLDVENEQENSDQSIAVLSISDTGIGIPKEELKTIFNRFHEVLHKKNTKLNESSGIGLNITKSYIKLHKGTIKVESILDKGSVFTIKLPIGEVLTTKDIGEQYLAVEEKILQKEEIGDQVHSSFNSKDLPVILVVEDNPDLLGYISSILKGDFNVEKALNGKEGLRIIEKELPDLIITDIMMPEMDGIAMSKIIKTTPVSSHIPIIMLTAKVSESDVLEGVENGADLYLTKPFSTELLLAYVKNLIVKRDQIRTKINNDLLLKPKQLEISTLDEQFLERLMNIMEENFNSLDFDIKQLSDLMFMSPRNMSRKIKALTSSPANEFIRSFRLKKAATILDKGRMPINEVSEMVGFNDPAYFSRCFQKKFGVPPVKYGSSS